MTAINRMERMNSSHKWFFYTLRQTHDGFYRAAQGNHGTTYYISTRKKQYLPSLLRQTTPCALGHSGIISANGSSVVTRKRGASSPPIRRLGAARNCARLTFPNS